MSMRDTAATELLTLLPSARALSSYLSPVTNWVSGKYQVRGMLVQQPGHVFTILDTKLLSAS
jgi:hypothetical protein